MSVSGYCQIEFPPDSVKDLLFPEMTSEIKDFDSRIFDFQYRVWFYEGLPAPPIYTLFVLTLNGKTWTWESYRTNFFENDNKLVESNSRSSNCKSILKAFFKNDFLTLPTMKTIEGKLFKINNAGDTTRLNIMDCGRYFFELIQNNKYRRYEYYCPQYYAKNYKHITELDKVNNILKIIQRNLKYKY